MDTIKDSMRLIRRRDDAALKARVLAKNAKPEVSVAGIALVHDLIANLVHKWRRMATVPSARNAVEGPMPAHSFIALPVAPLQVASVGELIIEQHRGAVTVKVTWPVAAARECVGWMCELLR